MDETFAEWIEAELARRGWRPADLARNSGITPQQVSRVLNSTRGFGDEFIAGIARAFGMPVAAVYAKAGRFSPPGPTLPEVSAWSDRLRALPETERRAVIQGMETLLGLAERR